MFFGTPHRGSKLGDWGNMASNIARAAFLKLPSQYLKALEENSEELMDISEEFVPLTKQYNFVCFTEENVLPWLGSVVRILRG